MITPLDIQNKSFKKELRGYSKIEVDEFLNLIINSYEKLYRESIEFRDEISIMQRTIDNYKALENTLKDTLIVAQKTGEQVKIQASEKAEVILNEAQVTAKKMINDAHEEVKKISFRYDELKRSVDVYQARMASLLNSQLDLLSNVSTNEKTLVELLGVNEALEEIELHNASNFSVENSDNQAEADDKASEIENTVINEVDVLLAALSADDQTINAEE